MSIRNKLIESLASTWKSRIDLYLRQEGYVTYADRLQDIKFIIADIYRGSHISVAAMFSDRAELVINPAMIDARNFQGQTKKMMDQLSVLIRHELLHFLLVHSRRMIDHLSKKDPEWEKKYRGYSIAKLSNFAADWELSNEGYDEHDKEVVRLMTKNGKVIGGLILSDDHPEWINLTYEEILDKLIEEKEKEIERAKQELEKAKQEKQKQQSQQPESGSPNSDEEDFPQDNNSEEIDDGQSSENKSEKDKNKKDENNLNNNEDSNLEDSEDELDPEEDQDSANERDYAIAWNEIIERFDKDEISEEELEQLIADIESGKIVEL